jgi:hypothetical protein
VCCFVVPCVCVVCVLCFAPNRDRPSPLLTLPPRSYSFVSLFLFAHILLLLIFFCLPQTASTCGSWIAVGSTSGCLGLMDPRMHGRLLHLWKPRPPGAMVKLCALDPHKLCAVAAHGHVTIWSIRQSLDASERADIDYGALGVGGTSLQRLQHYQNMPLPSIAVRERRMECCWPRARSLARSLPTLSLTILFTRLRALPPSPPPHPVHTRCAAPGEARSVRLRRRRAGSRVVVSNARDRLERHIAPVAGARRGARGGRRGAPHSALRGGSERHWHSQTRAWEQRGAPRAPRCRAAPLCARPRSRRRGEGAPEGASPLRYAPAAYARRRHRVGLRAPVHVTTQPAERDARVVAPAYS